MSINKSKDDNNKTYCKSVAKSISNIIRFSLDEEFRKSTFEFLGVSSTKEVEREINRKLMLIIDKENKVPQSNDNKSKKRRKNVLHKKDKESQKEPTDTLDGNEANQSSSTDKDESQVLFQNFLQQNVPQILPQQYRDDIKKRKLDYFSQPESSKFNQRDFELSKSHLICSYSQPSMRTSNSLFYEAVNSPSKTSDDGINYCRKMFTESFKNNAQKYLKKNLKSYRHINS